MDAFGSESSRFLILQSEKLRADTSKEYAKILNFLDLPQETLLANSSRPNTGSYPVKNMESRTRKLLQDIFDSYNQDLYKFLKERKKEDWFGVWDD
jgi:hypothetical protein